MYDMRPNDAALGLEPRLKEIPTQQHVGGRAATAPSSRLISTTSWRAGACVSGVLVSVLVFWFGRYPHWVDLRSSEAHYDGSRNMIAMLKG